MDKKDLLHKSCTPCKIGSPRISAAEEVSLLKTLDHWQIQEEKGVKKLSKTYAFKNFAEAWSFTSAVAQIAESEGHHPAVLTEWGSVTVTWYTHKIGGLHENDFIMAAKTDQIPH